MKKIFFTLIFSLSSIQQALANPACLVCTVAVGASLPVSRFFGISDNILAVWLGAMLAIIGYWSILLFEKKKWNFFGRDILLMGMSIAIISGVYIKDLKYTPKVICGIFYMDEFLFYSLIGALSYILSHKLYEYLKRKNGGHAHFPFEKVVIPIFWLTTISIFISYYS